MNQISKKHITFFSATAIVIANMIGTGVFTSLGFQLLGLSSPLSILLLWIVGGIVALCGALVYGELGAAMPKSGGEYHYLSRLYHPSVGFASGWVSSTVGFAAPVALAAMTLGKYSSDVLPMLNETYLAIGVVLVITAIHCFHLEKGIGFQNIATTVKVVLVLAFIICGFFIETPQKLNFELNELSMNEVLSNSFAVSLIFVSYAYSGWNASAYLTGEMVNPKKDLPKSLLVGTGVVMALYILLNYIFLYTAPVPELVGKVDVGYISAEHIFNQTGANIMGWVISLLLVSSISAMIIAGPRVAQSMGEDTKILSFLGKKTLTGIPLTAIIFQSSISCILIMTSSFDKVLTFVGFSLSLFTFLSVFGIFILRRKDLSNNTYKTFGYPFTPIIFLLLNLWTLYFVAKDKPTETLFGLGIVAMGFVLYFLNPKKESKDIGTIDSDLHK